MMALEGGSSPLDPDPVEVYWQAVKRLQAARAELHAANAAENAAWLAMSDDDTMRFSQKYGALRGD